MCEHLETIFWALARGTVVFGGKKAKWWYRENPAREQNKTVPPTPQEEQTVVWGGKHYITLHTLAQWWVILTLVRRRLTVLYHIISAGWVQIKAQETKSIGDIGSSSVTGSQEIMSKMIKSRKGTLLRYRKGNWVWWCMPVVPHTCGAEAGGPVEFRSSRPCVDQVT